MAEIYFSGQGVLYSADRDTGGNVTVFRDLGNVSSLRVSLETDTVEHKESRTGQRLTDFRLVREKRARVTMALESFTKANLIFLLQGTGTSGAGASVTAEVLPTALIVGDIVALANPNVTSLVIKDSAGSPATLTLGTHYTADTKSGMVTFVNVTGFTQPFKADYTWAANEKVQMFKSAVKERFFRFAGLNTANSDKMTIVELYRVLLDPAGNLDLINDELASFEVEGSVLYDVDRDVDASLGGFGRIIIPT